MFIVCAYPKNAESWWTMISFSEAGRPWGKQVPKKTRKDYQASLRDCNWVGQRQTSNFCVGQYNRSPSSPAVQ